MRFHALATDRGGALTGIATNDRCDPARRFCDAYRSAAIRLLTPDSLRLEPAIWSGVGDEIQRRPDDPVRFHFSEEEEPGLFEAVFECLGHDPSDFDVIVLMSEEMLSVGTDLGSILGVVIQDAASVLTDETMAMPEIGWAAPDVVRAAGAAVLVRAAEPLLDDPAAISDAYREICACAIAGLVGGRYGRINGEVIFVRENPGLVTLIKGVVTRASTAARMPLPVDASCVQRMAMDNIKATLETVAGFLQVA